MLKRTTEEVKAYFAEHGCELLDEYTGVTRKMKYRCKCGNLGDINWNNFEKGKRCGRCKKGRLYGKKHTLEEARLEFAERGCKLIDDIYLSAKTKMKCQCQCGEVMMKALVEIRRFSKCNICAEKQRVTVRKSNKDKGLHKKHNHPNWSRVKDGKWHLDHMFPIEGFVSHGITDIKLINHLDNLQPLTQRENLQKNAKYDKVAFFAWLRSKGYANA